MNRFIRLGLPFAVILCFATSGLLLAQQHDTVKVMYYNLLYYPDPGSGASASADTAVRNPHFRTIVQAANPDIMVICEMASSNGYYSFLNKVMNANGPVYAAGTMINGPDTDRGIYYRTSKFQFISNTPISTDLRDINMFKLVHIASGDTIRVFAVHLKAASGTTNELSRALEVDSLRKFTNALPSGTDFIVGGDFNIYGSWESAYQKLLAVQPGNEGHFHDALNLTGNWNTSAYAPYHTQSPRTRAFGGGATGGMDDRFDLILYSTAVKNSGGIKAIPSSLKAYGNDGLHYNDSINRMPNTAVSSAVANALHYASDHLPVMMNFDFEYGLTAIDAGVSSIIPPVSVCPEDSALLRVTVRNFGTGALDFSQYPFTVTLNVLNPSGVNTALTKNISSGLLLAGADTTLTMSNVFPMLNAGNYQFTASSASATPALPDANPTNDAAPQVSFNIRNVSQAITTPSGSISLCSGDSVLISASPGASYAWNSGQTSSQIKVDAAGSYSVVVTDNFGCTSVSSAVSVVMVASTASDTLFYESMGSVSTTTSISSHETSNGFLNDSLTMSGSGDVRSTVSSAGLYSGASGAANIFLTNVIGRNFIISGIPTLQKTNLVLSFAVYKSASTSTGADLMVEVSTDGVNWSGLSFPALPSGTASWVYRTCTGNIPSAANLRIRFQNNGTASQYRIDDVMLKGSEIPVITTTGQSFLCSGQQTTLSASQGSSWLWNTGATTQSIQVVSPGTYSVQVGCANAQPFTVDTCPGLKLKLKLNTQGLYLGQGLLQPRLFANGMSDSTSAGDSLIVALRNSTPPYTLLYSGVSLLQTDGFMFVNLPTALISQSVYIVVKGQSILETWSKIPVMLQPPLVFYNFTDP